MIALLTACLFIEILVCVLNCISKSARENCVRPPYAPINVKPLGGGGGGGRAKAGDLTVIIVP